MSSPTLSVRLRRIAAQARDGQRVFTTLAHLIDVELLRSAFGRHYYGIRGNYPQLKRYHQQVRRSWRKWLGRRSRESFISWKQFEQMEKKFPLPTPRIVHAAVQLTLAGQRSYALKWYRDFSYRGTV